MGDLTIDTQVLLVGSKKSLSLPKRDPKGQRSLDDRLNDCRVLLVEMMNDAELCLAIDSKGQIEAEYDSHVGDSGCLARQILTLYAKYGRIAKYDWDNKLWRRLRPKLSDLRFHRDDHKFIRTAAASETKRLVAEEAGYSSRAVKLIKEHALVEVLSAYEASLSL